MKCFHSDLPIDGDQETPDRLNRSDTLLNNYLHTLRFLQF